MPFDFSRRSLDNLIGVHEDLVMAARLAIHTTEVDFCVIQGRRTAAQQEEYFLAGKSQIRSGGKHQIGHAIDIAAYVDGAISWDWKHYPVIAAAFRQAAIDLSIPVVWGAVWDRQIGTLTADLFQEVRDYRARRNGKAFIDSGHFELRMNTGVTT
jgi:peptidoglycan L-alanyl-D-glutamate endopeptidase CwlK